MQRILLRDLGFVSLVPSGLNKRRVWLCGLGRPWTLLCSSCFTPPHYTYTHTCPCQMEPDTANKSHVFIWLLGGHGEIITFDRYPVVYLSSTQCPAVHTELWTVFTSHSINKLVWSKISWKLLSALLSSSFPAAAGKFFQQAGSDKPTVQ